MAFVHVDIVSNKLNRVVTFGAVIPIGKTASPIDPGKPVKPFQTLYLLHGIYGNHNSWPYRSRILDWAEEKNLAVIMPAGENHFYVDHADSGQLYGEFIGEELVELTRRLFPLSHSREDTFLGGLSMGGYGALRNGLKYSDTFSHIIALSSALIFDKVLSSKDNGETLLEKRGYYRSVFGDLDRLAGSDMDYKALVEMHQQEDRQMPQLYLACGTEDSLIGANRDYAAFLRERGVDLTYVEAPGAHTWDFWDTHLRKALDWLPLNGAAQQLLQ